MLSVGSLFSGVGGFDMGLERAGFRTAWQIENDRDAASVLERHWPDVKRYGDIRDVDPAGLEPVDVVAFGSPCQDFSGAGKRAGLVGERSGLFGEAIRILRWVRPAIALWENVPGALSSAGGRDFGAILDALADVGALDIAWRVLDAQYFGVPQRRRRIFLVADLRAERTGQVLFEPASGGGNPAPRPEAGQGAAGDVEDGAGSRSFPVAAFGGNRTAGAIEVATACNAHGGPHGRLDFGSETFLVANSIQASAGHHGHSSPRGDGADNLIVGAIAFHMTQDPINGAVSPALSGNAYVGDADVATFDEAQITSKLNRTRVEYGRPSDTLNSDSRINDVDARAGLTVRRLTPRECERLMGWPDDWTRYRADDSEIPDGPRYRMIGNGVVAPVAEWIARRLLAEWRS